jgi:hypothetical protein
MIPLGITQNWMFFKTLRRAYISVTEAKPAQPNAI